MTTTAPMPMPNTIHNHRGTGSRSPFAGVVAFSGRLLDPELLTDEAVSRPPVLLVRGDLDDVVNIEAMP